MRIYALITLVALSSCTSTSEVMNSYMGRHQSTVIQNFGPPARTADDGAGGKILCYSNYVKTAGTAGTTIYDNNGQGHYSPGTSGQAYYRNTFFYINPSGNVYHWLIQNSQVPVQQIDMNVYIH
jgi:hypothetical protein